MKKHCVKCDVWAGGSICPRCGNVMVYEPSQEEIRQRCEQLRRTWTESERVRRGEQVAHATIPVCSTRSPRSMKPVSGD